MTSGWALADRLPSADEHLRISAAVGWGAMFDRESLPDSLAGSCFGVVAVAGAAGVVGMGRVVGDGVKYFYLQDVAVLPEWQQSGIGRALVTRLLERIAQAAPAPAFVGLFATSAAEALYAELGFEPGNMRGMFREVSSDPQAAAGHDGT